MVIWARTIYRTVPGVFPPSRHNRKKLPTDGLVPDFGAVKDKIRRVIEEGGVDVELLRLKPEMIDTLSADLLMMEDEEERIMGIKRISLPSMKFPKVT